MKRIIVPVDFSKTSENAINFAVEAAACLKAEITLLNSFEVADGKYTDLMGVNREFTNDLVSEAKNKINDLRVKYMRQSAVEINTHISTQPLSEAINEAVEAQNADLVVMGTLGATGLKTKIWGSHTSDFIGKTKIPVIAVPSDYEWKKPEKILLASRKFERNPKIMDYLYEMSFLFSASVQTAVFTSNEASAGEYVENQKELTQYEDFLKKEYRDDTLSSVHLTGEKFEETLEKYINDHQIDLLTMITYQEGFWKSLFNPSMSKQMSFHTRVPLLVIPAGL